MLLMNLKGLEFMETNKHTQLEYSKQLIWTSTKSIIQIMMWDRNAAIPQEIKRFPLRSKFRGILLAFRLKNTLAIFDICRQRMEIVKICYSQNLAWGIWWIGISFSQNTSKITNIPTDIQVLVTTTSYRQVNSKHCIILGAKNAARWSLLNIPAKTHF